jgi:hypothetical protein
MSFGENIAKMANFRLIWSLYLAAMLLCMVFTFV